jgi:S-adenosylmethionine:tRNA ribosyltransferase-isomerase
MRVDLFDFDLPDERIALTPVRPRDAARLLVVGPGAGLADRHVSALPDLLRPGDALVLNDTKVIPAELHGLRHRGDTSARIRLNLFRRTDPATWQALARPAKRLAEGDVLNFGGQESLSLAGRVAAKGPSGEVTVTFDRAGAALDEAINAIGEVPLPPYIAGKRALTSEDRTDYQTIYAEQDGAVAAPTAGLHFTDNLFARLQARDISIHRLTLHVGAGTFLPVKADDTSEHRMHAEWGLLPEETAARLNEVRRAGGRVVAVGTTCLRLLESAAAKDGTIKPFAGETSIFLTPGSPFHATDALLTNFHLPRSTLFMLVAAFSGLDAMQAAYRHAIDENYRFYSYGDACLLFPGGR